MGSSSTVLTADDSKQITLKTNTDAIYLLKEYKLAIGGLFIMLQIKFGSLASFFA
jgi:hypothetical protein